MEAKSKLANKRGRATAIVNGYLTRTLKKEEMKNLSLSGVLSIPASLVDSSGLLGMALAFRAAAGEIPMPDDGHSRLKPWKQIDADGPKSSAERTKNLEKQLELILRKVDEIREATAKRREMTQVAIEQKHRIEEEIFALEVAAKAQVMSRTLKKKPVTKADAKLSGTASDGADVDGDTNYGPVVEVVDADDGALEAELDDSYVGGDEDEEEEEEIEAEEVENVEDEEAVEAVADDE